MKIAVKWLKGDNLVLNPGLLYLAGLVKHVAALFQYISYAHIYEQFNVQADLLSKESLDGAPLQIFEDEYTYGIVVSFRDDFKEPYLFKSV